MQTADTQACAQDAAFAHLRRLAIERPRVMMACAAAIADATRRDYLQRSAFFSALRQDMAVAFEMLPAIVDRAWAGDTPVPRALELIDRKRTPDTEKLLRASAARNPSLALRDLLGRLEEPYAAPVLERVIALVPDEAVAIAEGRSRNGPRIRTIVAGGTSPELRFLDSLLRDEKLGSLLKQRAAVFAGRLDRAAALAAARDNNRYFTALVELRLKASAEDAIAIDRWLQSYAQPTMLEIRQSGVNARRTELERASTRDLFLLLSYGRGEADKDTFTAIFDAFLLPKLRKQPLATKLRMRHFLTDVIIFGRLSAFLPFSGGIGDAFRGVADAPRPLDEAGAAMEILDALDAPEHLEAVAQTIAGEADHPLYGLLAARLARKHRSAAIDARARRYDAYLREPVSIASSALFNAGVSSQRYFFHNDGDGVESFESFRASYAGATGWRWEDHKQYIRLTGAHGARRIEIVANVPVDLLAQPALTPVGMANAIAASRALGHEPQIVVHRGHAYHVEKTLRELNASAQLVFLGSCRGLGDVDSVLGMAPAAQMIVSRAVGSHTVNDPLLRALNEEILRADTIVWRDFWKKLNDSLGANKLFEEYIPPHRNSVAILLAGYYAYLDASTR